MHNFNSTFFLSTELGTRQPYMLLPVPLLQEKQYLKHSVESSISLTSPFMSLSARDSQRAVHHGTAQYVVPLWRRVPVCVLSWAGEPEIPHYAGSFISNMSKYHL